jgi:hypothetical protein
MSSFGGKLTVRILVRTAVKIPFSTALVVSLLRADVAFKNEKSFLLCHGWIVMIASDSLYTGSTVASYWLVGGSLARVPSYCH